MTQTLPLAFDEHWPTAPAHMYIRTVALCAVEIIEGLRPLDQLGNWAAPHVIDSLATMRALRTERQQLYRRTQRLTPHPGRVRSSHVAPTIVESVVVMHAPLRSFATCIRFEWRGSAWRVTDLHVL